MLMLIRPSPMAETSNPCVPSLRVGSVMTAIQLDLGNGGAHQAPTIQRQYRDLAMRRVLLFFPGFDEVSMRKHRDGNHNDELTDDALLQREASERREYIRLGEKEPHLRD